jgi:beta-glucanase (GH16 family)
VEDGIERLTPVFQRSRLGSGCGELLCLQDRSKNKQEKRSGDKRVANSFSQWVGSFEGSISLDEFKTVDSGQWTVNSGQ